MFRRLILGVAVGLLAAFVATPVEAAEWCMDDPALVFSAPHAKHKITVYATEGVQGAEHASALRKAKVHLEAKPGKGRGTMDLEIRAKIPADGHARFLTVLLVSSKPYGAGTVYGVVRGSNDHDMNLRFELAYQDGG